MLPNESLPDGSHERTADAVSLSCVATAFIARPNRYDVGIAQPRIRVRGTDRRFVPTKIQRRTRAISSSPVSVTSASVFRSDRAKHKSCAPFLNHVGRVQCVRASRQVYGVATSRSVARVHDHFGPCSIRYVKNDSMRKGGAAKRWTPDDPVAFSVPSGIPRPALGRRTSGNFGPEKCDLLGTHKPDYRTMWGVWRTKTK